MQKFYHGTGYNEEVLKNLSPKNISVQKMSDQPRVYLTPSDQFASIFTIDSRFKEFTRESGRVSFGESKDSKKEIFFLILPDFEHFKNNPPEYLNELYLSYLAQLEDLKKTYEDSICYIYKVANLDNYDIKPAEHNPKLEYYSEQPVDVEVYKKYDSPEQAMRENNVKVVIYASS